jgi:hypothetical protein
MARGTIRYIGQGSKAVPNLLTDTLMVLPGKILGCKASSDMKSPK